MLTMLVVNVFAQFTGECECLDGYAGRACDYQDTQIEQGIVSF